MESYLRLALKAQARCRATAEALALFKNPQPDIAHGHQQVNNSFAGAPEQALMRRPSPTISERYKQAHAGAVKSSFEQS